MSFRSLPYRALPRRLLLALMLAPGMWSCGSQEALDTGGSAGPNGAGVLVVEPDSLEFAAEDGKGAVPARVDLRLFNTGSGPLHVVDVETHCGCTVPKELERDLLPPGESIVLAVSVKPPAYGKQETSLTIVTDSSQTARINVPVMLRGPKLQPPFVESAPPEVRLAGRRAGEAIEQEVLIRTIESPGPQWVSGLGGSQGFFDAHLVDVAHEEPLADEAVRRVYRFAVRSRTPVTPHAVVTDRLTIETNPPTSMRRVPAIPVTAEFTPAVRAVPHEVRLRIGDDSVFPMKRTVLLVATDDAPWSFALPDDLPDWLEVSADNLGGESAPGVKRLLVSVDEEARHVVSGETTPQRTMVRLRCTHPQCEDAELQSSFRAEARMSTRISRWTRESSIESRP